LGDRSDTRRHGAPRHRSIARDLRDVVIQRLFAAGMQVQGAPV
jgi:signal transduction histidine kinase